MVLAGTNVKTFGGNQPKIQLEGVDAQELFDYLTFSVVKEKKCIKHVSNCSGGPGCGPFCQVFEATPSLYKKSGTLFSCVNDIKKETHTCDIYPDIKSAGNHSKLFAGDEVQVKDSTALELGATGLAQKSPLVTSGTGFGLRCDELVADRLYDCFYRLTPSAQNHFFSLNLSTYFTPRFAFQGDRMTDGLISITGYNNRPYYSVVKALFDGLKSTGSQNSDKVSASFREGLGYSALVQGLTGTIIERNVTNEGHYQFVVSLDADVVKAIKDLIKTDSQSILTDGTSIFGNEIDSVVIEFDNNLEAATLTAETR